MNRNTLYEYLKSTGMKPLFIHKKHGYHVEYRLQPHQKLCQVVMDWGYVMGVGSIHLYANEVMLESQHSDMELNIPYKNLTKFEVEVFDEY